ncbi:MAG TPA: hypothetical protein VEY09_02355 [Pyrinomonadaceae bacterium]|nr:hypothetical protein [Pyrinomonadaceae bacterium]
MSGKRKALLIAFILASIAGMWARHASEQADKRKREALFRQLSLNSTGPSAYDTAVLAGAAPAAPVVPPEPRDMFDSNLPQEAFELVRQAAGRDFKLMELSFGDSMVFVKISADGTTVEQYILDKHRKRAEGPKPVQLIGDGKLSDSLFDVVAVDLSLIPKLSKEALERAGLPDAKVSRVSLSYPLFRKAGEGPEWTVSAERGEVGRDWQYKTVTFTTKGKFKRIS